MISYSRVFCYLAGYKGYFVFSDVAFYILVALKRLTSVLKGMNVDGEWSAWLALSTFLLKSSSDHFI